MDEEAPELPNLGIDFAYGSIELIKILNEVDLFKDFFSEYTGEEASDELFQGYKFAVLAALHRIINEFVISPTDVGVEPDEVIWNAYNWGPYQESALQSLPRDSSHGILLNNLLLLRTRVISSGNWEELKKNLYDVLDFLFKIENIFVKFYVGKGRTDDKIIDPTVLITRKLPSVLLIFLNDGGKLTQSYYDMYRSPKNVDSDIDLRRFTRKLGGNPFDDFIEFDDVDKHHIFLLGFKMANLFLWKRILGDELFNKFKAVFKKLYNANYWNEFDLLFGTINDKVCRFIENENVLYDYSFIKNAEITQDFIREIISPLDENMIQKEIELKLKLLFRPVSYVNHDASGALNFIAVLLGLVHAQIIRYMKEKARVIELVHEDKPGNNYSYAIFLPCSGTLSDSSRWWIFFRCATDYSGQGGFNHMIIHKFLDRYSEYVDYSPYKVDEDELRNYLRSDYIKYIEKQTKDAIDINSGMRGAFLELLVSSYLWKKKCEVYLRYEPKFLNKELDIVAIDRNMKTIYVVECKEKSVTVDSDEFDRLADEIFNILKAENPRGEFGVGHNELTFYQLSKFIKLIDKINNNLTMLLRELNIIEDDYRLIGILATTELYDIEDINLPDHIEFWTWWILRDKLISMDIDKSYLEILEKHMKSSMARPLRDHDYMNDYF